MVDNESTETALVSRSALPEVGWLAREQCLSLFTAAYRAEQQMTYHRREAERWQTRVALAERYGDLELAMRAAQEARRHAGLALAALRNHGDALAAARRLRVASGLPERLGEFSASRTA